VDPKEAKRLQISIHIVFLFLTSTILGCTYIFQSRDAHSELGFSKTKYEVTEVDLDRVKHFRGKLEPPIRGSKLTSKFGMRWRRFHEGVDLSAPSGTPIFAVHDGEVLYSGRGLSGYGNLIAIKSAHGLVTVYAHNKKNVVEKGQHVEAGYLIGFVGSTGNASGPHLHFETRILKPGKGFVAVDPSYFYQ